MRRPSERGKADGQGGGGPEGEGRASIDSQYGSQKLGVREPSSELEAEKSELMATYEAKDTGIAEVREPSSKAVSIIRAISYNMDVVSTH
ncbi:hypothetical protein ANO14919_117020 [Xylariales sp. No.14919]|nr:hypothetical protein ANO14919_117020 [Xylariales sp. No.14919]